MIRFDSAEPNRFPIEFLKIRSNRFESEWRFFIRFGLGHIHWSFNRLHIYLDFFCVLNFWVLNVLVLKFPHAHRSLIRINHLSISIFACFQCAVIFVSHLSILLCGYFSLIGKKSVRSLDVAHFCCRVPYKRIENMAHSMLFFFFFCYCSICFWKEY
jgi:hypothetical protein